MTHRGPFQPRPFCDSVINYLHRGLFICTSVLFYGSSEYFSYFIYNRFLLAHFYCQNVEGNKAKPSFTFLSGGLQADL